MARYVDGFVIPVPKKNLAAYKKMAKASAKAWIKHGALEYHESMADDVPKGKVTSFAKSVKLKAAKRSSSATPCSARGRTGTR